jgi:hypothetical protein
MYPVTELWSADALIGSADALIKSAYTEGCDRLTLSMSGLTVLPLKTTVLIVSIALNCFVLHGVRLPPSWLISVVD